MELFIVLRVAEKVQLIDSRVESFACGWVGRSVGRLVTVYALLGRTRSAELHLNWTH